jgi:hypothetical protein
MGRKSSFSDLKNPDSKKETHLCQKSVKPALLRQATYGTLKLGIYQYLKKLVSAGEAKQSLYKNIACAVVAGASANALANPTDVLKVRMQAQGQLVPSDGRPKSLAGMFVEIYHKEGVKGIYRVTSSFLPFHNSESCLELLPNQKIGCCSECTARCRDHRVGAGLVRLGKAAAHWEYAPRRQHSHAFCGLGDGGPGGGGVRHAHRCHQDTHHESAEAQGQRQ